MAEWHTLFDGIQDANYGGAPFAAPFVDNSVLQIQEGYQQITEVEVTYYAEGSEGDIEGTFQFLDVGAMRAAGYDYGAGAFVPPSESVGSLHEEWQTLGLRTVTLLLPGEASAAGALLFITLSGQMNSEQTLPVFQWRKVRIFGEFSDGSTPAFWTSFVESYEIP